MHLTLLSVCEQRINMGNNNAILLLYIKNTLFHYPLQKPIIHYFLAKMTSFTIC